MPRERFGSNMSSWFSLNDYHPFSYNDRVILCLPVDKYFGRNLTVLYLLLEGY